MILTIETAAESVLGSSDRRLCGNAGHVDVIHQTISTIAHISALIRLCICSNACCNCIQFLCGRDLVDAVIRERTDRARCQCACADQRSCQKQRNQQFLLHSSTPSPIHIALQYDYSILILYALRAKSKLFAHDVYFCVHESTKSVKNGLFFKCNAVNLCSLCCNVRLYLYL